MITKDSRNYLSRAYEFEEITRPACMRGSDTTPALRDIMAKTQRAKTTQTQMRRGVYELYPREPKSTPHNTRLLEIRGSTASNRTCKLSMDRALTNEITNTCRISYDKCQKTKITHMKKRNSLRDVQIPGEF